MENLFEIEAGQTGNHVPAIDLHQTATTQFIEVKGIRFAFRLFGNKEGLPLVLLQHFTGTMDNWDPAITNGLARYFRIIIFDNKGIGATNGETPDNIAAMAEDAISFIKSLGINRINLLGFSMGGFIAQQIALDEPDLINKLILAGTGHKGGEGLANSENALAFTMAMTPEDQKLYFFYHSTQSSRALGKESLVRIGQRKIDRDPDTSLPGILAQLKAIVDWAKPDRQALDRLKQIRQPVFIVNGSNDIICPTVNSFIMFQNLPDSKLSLYPDSAHGSIFQYPEWFLDEAIPFLKGA